MSNWRSPKRRARKPTHRRKRDADRFCAALGADVIRYGGGRNIRLGVGMVEAMLKARGGSLVVIDDSEVPDDLVQGHDRGPDLLLRPPLRETLRGQPRQARPGGRWWLN